MGLDTLLRSAVQTANRATSSLQAVVSHQAWTGQDDYGTATYAAAVSRKAIVEKKQKVVKTASGLELLSRHVITFLEPVEANGATGRREPIDERDLLTLPDGSTGPILSVEGPMDPASGQGFLHEVALG